ncbi:MAG: FAD-binding protein [Planctomycetaceae bacterium]|jgi:Fe-S oxidoreductase/FAD/FMN-containing dehydrogenase|nr:FAD-binding protein [Planctomycetaceae bacterium]
MMRLQDDLRGLLAGDVCCDEITRHLYSTDAGVLSIRPAGVVFPKNTGDTVAVVRYAAENGLTVRLRGSGTGTVGESLGEGLVLDFSRYMNRLECTGSDFVTVQPGVPVQGLNTVLTETQQRQFAPLCGSELSTTVGSVLSRNAAGRRFLQYGLPRDYLLEAQIVLNGTIQTISQEHLPERAIITAAKLRTVPLPNRKAAAVLFFDSIEKAVRAVDVLLPFRLSLCELIDRRHSILMREYHPQFQRLLPVEAEAALCVELNAGNIAEPVDTDSVREHLREMLDSTQHRQNLCFRSIPVEIPEDFERFDLFLEKAERVLFQMRSFRPLPQFDNLTVPVSNLPAFLPELLDTFRRHSTTASLAGHIGQGQLRVFPLLNSLNKENILPRLTEEVYVLVARFGGTAGTPLIPPLDNGSNTRPGNGISPQLQLQLRWEPERAAEDVRRCNNCGECFRNDHRSRMCPVLRADRREENSPRAKVNLIRGILNGQLGLETLTLEQSKKIADSCIQCGRCRSDCPAQTVLVPSAFRLKSAYAAAHGLPLEDLFWSHLDTVLKWAVRFRCSVKVMMQNRFSRWILEKLLQLPQERQLPIPEKFLFLRRKRLRELFRRPYYTVPDGKTERVALFIDTYSNYFEPQLAEAAVRILEAQEVNVFVPLRQRPSGLLAFATGNRDVAERTAGHNTALLSDLIRQGYTVVALEPASASCLSQDYSCVLDGEDAALLSQNVIDFCTFLYQRIQRENWKPDFKPVNKKIGYHTPCRSNTAAGTPSAAEELLRLIPGLEVRHIERGCCGAAGMFGFKRRNYRQSLKIGMNLFRELRAADIEYGVSDCNVCRLQMEHGAKKKTLHPIQLLAEALELL